MTTVYVLDDDIERYQSLDLVDDDSCDQLLKWLDAVPIGKKWPRPEVEIERGTKRLLPGDFPSFGLFPVFSGRAIETLRGFLAANGEILPLRSRMGEYFAYNVTTLSDALDEQNSTCACFNKDGTIEERSTCVLAKGEKLIGVGHPAFHPAKLDGLTIFKLKQA